ncbi:CpsD/CapB family tyrosine-protein kinase [Halopseudomonas xiamenensis]|uniref:CpsD/CapB family tyrosine-protein kinase n=1 Tax=Halopseudomonas xiamenensis TaxID=157792 RepID=UPI001627CBFB|nr:CpsD/CapB family tyrosine-protein kinase [Halopseudomonas xiamenensis]
MNPTSTPKIKLQSPSETNLATTVLDQELKTLLVTSPNSGAGVSSSAMVLASELASSCRGKVLLVDACLSKNSLTSQLESKQHPGFLELTLADPPPTLESCIINSPDQLFDIMPLGDHQRHTQRLAPDTLHQTLARLTEVYRFIIIDGSAIYADNSMDTLALSAVVDGVVLVVRAEDTRWEVAQAAVQRLNQAGAKVIGSVLNARRYYMPKWLYDLL